MNMETITLNRIYEQLVFMNQEIQQMKVWMAEDFELADEVILEIETSRKKPRSEFVSHADMKKEFG